MIWWFDENGNRENVEEISYIPLNFGDFVIATVKDKDSTNIYDLYIGNAQYGWYRYSSTLGLYTCNAEKRLKELFKKNGRKYGDAETMTELLKKNYEKALKITGKEGE